MSTTAYMPVKESTTARTSNKGNILGSTIAGGAFATVTQKLMLPEEARAALKIARCSQDAYVGKMQKAAAKTMQATGKTFNLNTISENAKNLHSEMMQVAKPIRASLAKTFIGTAVAVLCAKLLTNMVLKDQIDNTNQNSKE